MVEQWRLNKTVEIGSCRAYFWTLFEDQRDTMSDCVRPVWGVSEKEKNRKVEIKDHAGRSVFCRVVSREEGNGLYKSFLSGVICR